MGTEMIFGMDMGEIMDIKSIIDYKFRGDTLRFIRFLQDETAEIQRTIGENMILRSKLKRIGNVINEKE